MLVKRHRGAGGVRRGGKDERNLGLVADGAQAFVEQNHTVALSDALAQQVLRNLVLLLLPPLSLWATRSQ